MAFEFGFGGSTKSESGSSSGSQTLREKQSQTSEAKTTTAQTGTSAQQASARYLDETTQKTIQDLISSLAGSATIDQGLAQRGAAGAEAAIQQALSLSDRAAGTGAFVENNIAPIISDARRTGERELSALGTGLAQQAGSSLNSLVQTGIGEGRADLESKLAALQADLTLQGRQLESQDANAALAALISASGSASSASGNVTEQVTQLASILKGATGETVGTGTEQLTGSSNTSEIATALRDVLTQYSNSSKGKATGGNVSFTI